MGIKVDDLRERYYRLVEKVNEIEDKFDDIEKMYCPVCEKERLVYSFVTEGEVAHRCLACLSLLGMAVLEEGGE